MYSFLAEKTNTGYSAISEDMDELPVASTGKDLTELNDNILLGINLYREHAGLFPITDDNFIIKCQLPL
ncbi:MAG: hypothetical protein WB562_02010 [Candidatus Sulfotelmatobacter sp.]